LEVGVVDAKLVVEPGSFGFDKVTGEETLLLQLKHDCSELAIFFANNMRISTDPVPSASACPQK
jgi:hypothetical protein